VIEQNAASPAHGYAPGEAAFLFATVRPPRDFPPRLADTMAEFSGHSFREPYSIQRGIRKRPQPEETAMREFVRPVASALGIACLLVAIAVASCGGAWAQAKQEPAPQAAPPPALKQMALTEKQIEGVLTAQKETDAITAKLPDNAKPDPKVIAQLDAVAKKNGFAGYDEYNNVVDNISLVLGGFDPATKKYVGSETVIKAQIAQVQADKKMPAKDKKAALADLNEALKTPPPPIENKGNIDLVTKYYDKLADALGDDEQ
jgi:hypothetical protein